MPTLLLSLKEELVRFQNLEQPGFWLSFIMGITNPLYYLALFGGVLNCDPKNPWKPERDRVILSNGHICPVWYATLAHAGFFPHSELKTLRKLGSGLQSHPEFRKLPGVENTGGPLGQGLSQAIGHA